MTNDEKNTEGARLMADAAQEAAEAAHKIIFEKVNASGLSEKRKIGAAITGTFQMMAAMLECSRDKGQGPEFELCCGMFETFIADHMTALYAMRDAARDKAKRHG